MPNSLRDHPIESLIILAAIPSQTKRKPGAIQGTTELARMQKRGRETHSDPPPTNLHMPEFSDPAIPDDLAVPKYAVLKRALVRLGRTPVGSAAGGVQATLNYLLLGAWMRRHRFSPMRILRDRRAVFEHAADLVGRNTRLLYLEFGVYRGASIQAWTRLNVHPESRFVGFDSFRGMPATFDERTGVIVGELDLGGRTPAISDPRVSWQVGWFHETLPHFQIPPHDRLVVHIDCDLYSATAIALEHIDSAIQAGSVVLFDDMGSPQHEPRAFADYIRRAEKRFELLACDREDHFAFQCLAD